MLKDEIDPREDFINMHSILDDFLSRYLKHNNSQNFYLLKVWRGADIEIIKSLYCVIIVFNVFIGNLVYEIN